MLKLLTGAVVVGTASECVNRPLGRRRVQWDLQGGDGWEGIYREIVGTEDLQAGGGYRLISRKEVNIADILGGGGYRNLQRGGGYREISTEGYRGISKEALPRLPCLGLVKDDQQV